MQVNAEKMKQLDTSYTELTAENEALKEKIKHIEYKLELKEKAIADRSVQEIKIQEIDD